MHPDLRGHLPRLRTAAEAEPLGLYLHVPFCLDRCTYCSFVTTRDTGLQEAAVARLVRDVAAWAPADRILVETDAPFLAPVPYRGKPNEPGFVRYTAEVVAGLRGIPPARLAELTTQNLEALCGWAPSS